MQKLGRGCRYLHGASVFLSCHRQVCSVFFAVLFSIFSVSGFASGVAGSATSAPCDNATLETYSGDTDLQATWEPNTIDVTWYSDGSQLSVQASATTCVYDDDLYLPAAPTKTGYTFKGWTVRSVPEGFTRLEYIEGGKNTNSYINLGYAATTTMRTLMVASVISNVNQQVLFGAADASAYAGGKAYSIDRFPTYVLIPNGEYNSDTSNIKMPTVLGNVYEYKINYPAVGIIGVDNTTKTAFTNLSSVSSRNLYVFGFNANNTYSSQYSVGAMRLYGLTIWDGNKMLHNYLPAKNGNGVVGLYDTVSDAFLTNAGSGAFTAGPAAQ
jgi:hypothetical protein